LIVAEKMFSKYKKLSDILKDTANYIFVDEYQDTSPLVVKILLEHLRKSTRDNIVGFFGDSMQAIYDSGVGNIDSYGLEKIQKNQNRRNPRKVINLANKFRSDGLVQI
ncbi:UvrD-helicase domain-containing protein, partial [Streptococcus gordonii]